MSKFMKALQKVGLVEIDETAERAAPTEPPVELGNEPEAGRVANEDLTRVASTPAPQAKPRATLPPAACPLPADAAMTAAEENGRRQHNSPDGP